MWYLWIAEVTSEIFWDIFVRHSVCTDCNKERMWQNRSSVFILHSIAKCTKMLRCVINLRPTDGIGYSEYCIVDACFMQGSTTAGTLALVFATQISGFFAGSSKTRNATFVVSCALPIAEICLHRESACTVSFSSAWSD